MMRALTSEERRILNRILAQIPNAKDQLKQQARSAKVITLDAEGSLRFALPPSITPLTISTDRVPVTGIFDDDDGIPVYILLHIEGGKISELEIYKADGSTILRRPAADKLYF